MDGENYPARILSIVIPTQGQGLDYTRGSINICHLIQKAHE